MNAITSQEEISVSNSVLKMATFTVLNDQNNNFLKLTDRQLTLQPDHSNQIQINTGDVQCDFITKNKTIEKSSSTRQPCSSVFLSPISVRVKIWTTQGWSQIQVHFNKPMFCVETGPNLQNQFLSSLKYCAYFSPF